MPKIKNGGLLQG